MAPDYNMLSPESDTIEPLPHVLRYGLGGVVVLATLSLISTSILFAHLTFKLIRYSIKRFRRKSLPRQLEAGPRRDASLDLHLGLDESHFGASKRSRHLSSSDKRPRPVEYPAPNQFVVLLYNLLLADMHQAIAFLLNIVWVVRDGIFVQTPECWTQGFFVSVGDLASSCFIAAVALHTYLTIVRDYRPPEWLLNGSIAALWLFVYGITIAGIISTGNGKDSGGYFVRASAWVSLLTGGRSRQEKSSANERYQCWINDEYDTLRLITHYIYIFIALVATPLVYFIIFLHLRTRLMNAQMQERLARQRKTYTRGPRPPLRHKSSVLSAMSSAAQSRPADSGLKFDHHPAFLVYPVIYVVCTLPLALGRVGSLAGADVPLWYFCVAGALITSNGWLDVLLWGTTRHKVVFGPIDDADALGLDTFDFMRTPPNREFGNIVWVQGAGTTSESGRAEGSGARKGRPAWTLLDRFFGGGETGTIDEGVGREVHGDRNSSLRSKFHPGPGFDNRGSGTLQGPGHFHTYRPGHVNKHATNRSHPETFQPAGSPSFRWSRDFGPSDVLGGIAIKKEAVVTVSRVDNKESESGFSSPDYRTGSSFSHRDAKDGYFS